MTRILAALILSTAAIGAAQAGEIGYLDNPGSDTRTTLTREQVQADLNAHRADVRAFQGELNQNQLQSRPVTDSRANVIRDQKTQPSNAVGVTFVNG
jgi:recombination DNA repair RAD52 pathway protein